MEGIRHSLNMEMFQHSAKAVSAVVPVKEMSTLMKKLKSHMLSVPKLWNVFEIPGDKTRKWILFKPESMAESAITEWATEKSIEL